MSGKEWTKETFPEWEKERFLAKTRPKLKSVICCESVVRKKVSDVVRKCDFEREREIKRDREKYRGIRNEIASLKIGR